MNDNNNNWGDWGYWIATIILFCTPVWPIGLVMLFRKLMGYTSGSARKNRQSRHPYDIQREGQKQSGQQNADGTYHYSYIGQDKDFKQAPKQAAAQPQKAKKTSPPPTKGKALTTWGAILSIIGGAFTLGVFSSELAVGLFEAFTSSLFPLGLTAAGLVLLYAGIQRNRKSKRYRRYQALIGTRETISIHSLAEALSLPYQTVCEELQDMLDEGIFPVGYVDIMGGRLVLNNEGLDDRDEQEEQEAPTVTADRFDAILREIRQVNDDIADPELSRKIDRIELITGKIFAYLKSHPEKESQLRSFLNYYLPTTLKILHAYAQLEAQGIEGENISAAKDRIENMMDKVVEGFEKQLDKLFQDSTLDITTDVQVLEQMLNKDGLSDSGDSMTLGG